MSLAAQLVLKSFQQKVIIIVSEYKSSQIHNMEGLELHNYVQDKKLFCFEKLWDDISKITDTTGKHYSTTILHRLASGYMV